MGATVFGLAAICQVLLIPGYLIVRHSSLKFESLIHRLVAMVGLSLAVNYVVIYVSAKAGVYGGTFVTLLVMIEVAALLASALFARRGESHLDFGSYNPWLGVWYEKLIAGAAAVVSMGFVYALVVRHSQALVFVSWDALMSWQPWSMIWYGGASPDVTGIYPQLLPAIWSMMYHVMGSPELQSFPLAVNALLSVLLVGMAWDLALRFGRIEYLVAVVAGVPYLWWLQGGRIELLDGYADLMVMFMSAGALYFLSQAFPRRPATFGNLLLSLVFASAAAVSKLSGLFVLAFVGGVVLASYLRERSGAEFGWSPIKVALLFVPVGTVALPWWVERAAGIVAGRHNYAELDAAVVSSGGGTSLGSRLLNAVDQVPGELPVILVVAACLGLALRIRHYRAAVLFLAVPYLILWGLFLSYDFRNALPVVPLVAVAASAGLLVAVRWVDERLDLDKPSWPAIPRSAPRVGLSMAAVALLAISFARPSPAAVDMYVGMQSRVGNLELNDYLRSEFTEHQLWEASVVTDYAHLARLPDFRSDPLRMASKPGGAVVWRPTASIQPEHLREADVLVLSNFVGEECEATLTQMMSSGEPILLDSRKLTEQTAFPGEPTIRIFGVPYLQ